MDSSCLTRSDNFLRMFRLVSNSARLCRRGVLSIDLAFLIMDHGNELHLLSLFVLIHCLRFPHKLSVNRRLV